MAKSSNDALKVSSKGEFLQGIRETDLWAKSQHIVPPSHPQVSDFLGRKREAQGPEKRAGKREMGHQDMWAISLSDIQGRGRS